MKSFVVAICLMALSGCGHDSDTVVCPSGVTVSILSPTTILVMGETQPFTAQVETDCTVQDLPVVVWNSDNPDVASVDTTGTVTGHMVGVAYLSATYGTGGSAVQSEVRIGVVSPNTGSGTLQISGVAAYEDKAYDTTGLLTQSTKPIRNGLVYVISIDGFGIIATGMTASDGTFSFTNINHSAPRGGVYIQVWTQNTSSQITVKNDSVEAAVYSVISISLDDSLSSTFLNTTIVASALDVGGAFNILDVAVEASEFVQAACTPTAPCIPPPLTLYWETGNGEGSAFSNTPNSIVIGAGDFGSNPSGDEYDDAVIAHEYGHFILSHFSSDQSLGGAHFLTDHQQDIRLSWSEGWATFFSSAARNDPSYVDTGASGVLDIVFELEKYASAQILTLSQVVIYSTSEIAVAGVLWDLYDHPVSDDDLVAGVPFETILEAVQGMTITSTTLESFWQILETQDPAIANGFLAILQERQIEFFPDPYDVSGEQPLIQNGNAQHHTLYQSSLDPTGDIDTISISVITGKQYTVETFGLTNGADTIISLPSLLLTNDNGNGAAYTNCVSDCPVNNSSNLSSRIVFTAPRTETITVSVSRSPQSPPSAGQFGSYDIQLQ